MDDSGMIEITRFERMAGPPPTSPTQLAPPPISPEAMAAVSKANRLAKSVSGELPLEWPQSPWVSRPVLAIAITSVVLFAGGLGYYIFSEGQAILEKSRNQAALSNAPVSDSGEVLRPSAEISDRVNQQAAAPLREASDRMPPQAAIPPTAPLSLGQWVPDSTSQGQGQIQGTGNGQIQPPISLAQAQPQMQARPQMPAQPQAIAQPQMIAQAPRTLAQTAPQLTTTSITVSAAAPAPVVAPVPAPVNVQAPALALAPVPASVQAPAISTAAPAPAGGAPAPAAATPEPAPAPLVGPQAPKATNPKAIEANIADQPAEGTPQPIPLVVRVRTKEARFHSGPGVQYPIIAVARAETRYAVADWSDRWFKVAIRLPTGTTMGWIRNDQVLITPGNSSESLPAFPEE